jgi:hypothetical protein
MPSLDRVIMESDLTSSRAAAGMDLTPYYEILDQIRDQGGVGGELTLMDEESQRTEKRRLSVAAKQRGLKLTWRKSPPGRLRFVLSSAGAPPPDGRRRRRAG